MDYQDWWDDLAEPFKSDELEWRVQSGAVKNGKPWAMVLVYVTARAIMNRLDNVVGASNWQNDFKELSNGATLCGISIKIDGEWVTKWNGSGDTKTEAEKGAISGAEKRAAVEWGIGRYLYGVGTSFANIHDGGSLSGSVKKEKNSKEYVYFKYDPPLLPEWAQPQPAPQRFAKRFNRRLEACDTAEEYILLLSKHSKDLKYLPESTMEWFTNKAKDMGFVAD